MVSLVSRFARRCCGGGRAERGVVMKERTWKGRTEPDMMVVRKEGRGRGERTEGGGERTEDGEARFE